MEERTPPPSSSSSSSSSSSASPTTTSPYSPLHPLLIPTPNPHLLVKPKTLTLSLASSPSFASPPPSTSSDAWEFVAATAVAGDGGLDDCAIFPPCLHEGLEVEQIDKEAAQEEAEEGWRGRAAAAARRAWNAGVEAVQRRVFVRGQCGCALVRPAVWSAAAVALVVGALLYARRLDRKERDLLVLLSQEKDKRIAQLLHQIAFMNDIRGGNQAVSILKNA